MRFGLIGTGSMAQSRAQAGAWVGLELAWVCSRDAQRAVAFIGTGVEQGFANKDCDVVTDWGEAIRRADIDAVIITTPNSAHYAPAIAALEAGKHVLVEYPPTTTMADGESLLERAARHGVAFHVGLTHRYGSTFETLRRVLRPDTGGAGPLGRPRLYLATSCGGRPIGRWYNRDKLTGGTFVSSIYDMAAVAMDLMGPVRCAAGSYQATHGADDVIVQDCASIQLSFQSGGAAQLNYARGFPAPGCRMPTRILCEGGYLILEDGIRQLTPDGEQMLTVEPSDAVEQDMLAFITAAEDPGKVDPTGPFALEVLDVVLQGAASCA